MFKSKLLYKIILTVFLLFIGYVLAVSFFVFPNINQVIYDLEEENAKSILDKVVTISKNVATDLKNFKKAALQRHKDELRNLTDIEWSILKLKYEQSKPSNIGLSLKTKAEEFKSNLMKFYNKNKNHMSNTELKKAITDFIRIYRYNNGIGYFFVNDFNYNAVINPVNPSIEGKNFQNVKDENGVYFVRKMVELCKKNGNGIVSYQWINPLTKKIGEKITYVFKFEPFNWIIGTGEYYDTLNKKLKNEVIELVNKLRYGDNNYFFISDYNSVLISHPYLQGKDFSNVRDKYGNLIVPPMVEVARKKGEGYTTYWWNKNTSDKTIYEKLTYSKDFPNWKMVIGTGVYIDDINKEIKKIKNQLFLQLEDIMKQTKIGKTGYIYIFNGKGEMLIHPNDNIKGTNFKDLVVNGNFNAFSELLKKSKTTKELKYKWDKPDDKGHYVYDKISWIEYLPELDWYIASSAYLNELQETSILLKNKIIISGLAVFFVFILISFIFFKKMLSPITKLSNMANSVAKGNYGIRANINRNDEIGQLANDFNIMVNKIEDNIKNLDQKIKEATAVSQQIIDTAIEGVLVFKEGRCIKINESGMNILRCTDEKDILGKTVYDFIPKHIRKIVTQKRKEETTEIYELTGKRLDGELFPMLTKGHTLKLSQGELRIIVAIDISDLKNREKELKIAKIKAEESTKLKSEFLANMSHEIRTPMNGIIGMAHLILQTKLNNKQKNYIQKIEHSAKSLLGIINDILDFSKIEAGKLSIDKIEFNLFEVIDDVISMIEFKAHEKNLEIVVDYSPNIGMMFYGDRLRVSQILTNLMNNAVKFTENGEINLYIRKISNDRFRFEVKDTGIGLTQEQQEKLFQSFSQADGSTTRKYGGTGLGLTISKQLIELMNGNIRVESKKGVGSSFIFEIELKQLNEEVEFKSFKNKIVMVVDDNASWHSILGNLLETFGIKVIHAYSAKEAIEIISADEPIELILMDWNMPETDGIEATKMINDKLQNNINSIYLKPKKIIMVSAFRQEEIIKRAKEVGIEIFLQKPVNPKDLNDVLCEIFNGDIKRNYSIPNKQVKSLKDEIMILNGSKLLLVEDNIINQEIITGLLEHTDIKLDIANNGKEAIELFKSTEYELILMDIQMPIMDGYEATSIIKKINPNIPIIALTANAMKENMEKSKNVGMNAHLNKPIDVEKFYETLLKYVNKKNNFTVKQIDNKDILLPEFNHIDTNKGLNYMAGNKKLYLKILKDFYLKYKDMKFEQLADDEFKRIMHTIKGLSANIGAMNLHIIAKKIDENNDKNLLDEFYTSFNLVMDDLKNLKIPGDIKKSEKLNDTQKNMLYKKLKSAIEDELSKDCQKIIDEILMYDLTDKDYQFIKTIKNYIEGFDFDEALNYINTGI